MFWFMEFCEIYGGYYNQIQLVTTRMGKKGTCLESLLLQPRALAGIIKGNYALPCVYCMSFKAALALPHIKISWAKMLVFQLMSCITRTQHFSLNYCYYYACTTLGSDTIMHVQRLSKFQSLQGGVTLHMITCT